MSTSPPASAASGRGARRSETPSGSRRGLVALLAVVALVPLLAIVVIARSGDEEGSPPEIPPVPEVERVEGPLRAGDPSAGRFGLDLPGGWVEVPTDEAGIDRFVAETESAAQASVVSQLRPAVLGEGEDGAAGTVAIGEALRETPLLAVAGAGDGYVIVTTTSARGSSLDDIAARLESELGGRGTISADAAELGGHAAVRLTQTTTGGDGREAVLLHDAAVVGEVVFILTATGSAPTQLAGSVAFEGVPDGEGGAARVTVPLHPNHPDAALTATLPPGWVDLPGDVDGFDAARDELSASGADPALLDLLGRLRDGPVATGAATPDSLVPRAVLADPYARAYVLVSSADVGPLEFDAAVEALDASAPELALVEDADAVGGIAGVSGASTAEGVVTTTSAVPFGRLLVTVTTSGEGAEAVAETFALDGAPPIPEVEAGTPAPTAPPIPPTSVVPVRELVLPLRGDSATALRFPAPEGWVEVPTDAEGYDAFAADRGGAVRDLLARVRPGLVTELPELPFELDLGPLPTARWISVAPDGSAVLGIQTWDAGGRSLGQLVDEIVAGADGDITTEPSPLVGIDAVRVVRGGVVYEVTVAEGTLVALVHGGELPPGFVDGARIG